MSQSLAQERAKDALKKINVINGQNNSWESNYLAYVKSLPATIIMTGLGQALAMEKAGASKSGDVAAGHEKLYEHMNDWLCARWRRRSDRPAPTDVLSAITNGQEKDYIHAQAEALEYLEWLKKFAVAFLVKNAIREDE